MRVAIYGRKPDEEKLPFIRLLFHELNRRNAEIKVFKRFQRELQEDIAELAKLKSFNKHQDLRGKTDYLISIGGDGTLLDTLTFIRDSGIPVLGINIGRLGFLSSIGKEEIGHALNALEEGKYLIDKRSMIRLDAAPHLFGEINYALNEFTIHKRESTSMIRINTYINEEFLTTFWADGLIVATPTGSTAYSLSCGGPIILPESKNFVITPVAPHNLSVRPIVVPDDSVIRFEPESRQDQFYSTLDSRQEEIKSQHELIVRKADFSFNLIRLPENNFLKTLRNKLHWGYDKRNF